MAKKGGKKGSGKSRRPRLERQTTIVASYLYEQIQRNKDIFFIAQLVPDVEAAVWKTCTMAEIH